MSSPEEQPLEIKWKPQPEKTIEDKDHLHDHDKHLKRKARHLNAVSALGTIWHDSSKLDCRNTRDLLLMVPFRDPSVLLLGVSVILEWKAHMRSDKAESSSPQGLPAVTWVLRTMRTIPLPNFYRTITMVVLSRPEGVQRLHPAPLCRL